VAHTTRLKGSWRLATNTKALLAALTLAACGSSDELPPPAGPGGLATTTDGRYVGVVDPRARTLTVSDARTGRRVARANVGVGPTNVIGFKRRFFVVDTRGNGLIEVHLRGSRLVVHRRVHVEGGPHGITFDRCRGTFGVTLTETGQVAEVNTRRVLTVR
jgi:DNA-binding beta-propeller fold protein YncE